MPRRILGYPLTIDWRAKRPQTLELPIYGATPLSVKLVDGSFVLYVEHDIEKDGTKMRKVVIFKAGQDVDFHISGDKDYIFLGTVVNGPWAWHVYIQGYKMSNTGELSRDGLELCVENKEDKDNDKQPKNLPAS